MNEINTGISWSFSFSLFIAESRKQKKRLSLQHTRKNQLKYTEDIEIVEQSDSDEENFQPSGNSEIMKLNYYFTAIRYYPLKNIYSN